MFKKQNIHFLSSTESSKTRMPAWVPPSWGRLAPTWTRGPEKEEGRGKKEKNERGRADPGNPKPETRTLTLTRTRTLTRTLTLTLTHSPPPVCLPPRDFRLSERAPFLAPSSTRYCICSRRKHFMVFPQRGSWHPVQQSSLKPQHRVCVLGLSGRRKKHTRILPVAATTDDRLTAQWTEQNYQAVLTGTGMYQPNGERLKYLA